LRSRYGTYVDGLGPRANLELEALWSGVGIPSKDLCEHGATVIDRREDAMVLGRSRKRLRLREWRAGELLFGLLLLLL
jgi:hypothetical protein